MAVQSVKRYKGPDFRPQKAHEEDKQSRAHTGNPRTGEAHLWGSLVSQTGLLGKFQASLKKKKSSHTQSKQIQLHRWFQCEANARIFVAFVKMGFICVVQNVVVS